MKSSGFLAVFHYLSLHTSEFFEGLYDGRNLPMTELYSDRLIRLPFFVELSMDQVDRICKKLIEIIEEYAH